MRQSLQELFRILSEYREESGRKMARKPIQYAGKTVKVKSGVGKSSYGQDMSGAEFVVEDWWENVAGISWLNAIGNPAALEYAARHAFNGENNNVPMFSNDVVYGKIGGLGHIFHVNELEVEE